MNLGDLEPRALWGHFFSICGIPHTSRDEAALGDWVLGWARQRGLEAERDGGGNVIVRKAATPGLEDRTGIILQAHLDMVGEARSDTKHDFARDPIRPRIDPVDSEWLIASGTTLGADNGLGLAAALAFLEDDSLRHGPLECVFTVNEEDGMDGARGLAPAKLRGHNLLNLDGEDSEEITIGCAGMLKTKANLSLPAEKAPGGLRWVEIAVSGLLGGHSGMDINRGRANAILCALKIAGNDTDGMRLALIDGGSAANAIPREARLVVALPSREAHEAWKSGAEERIAALKAEFAKDDPGLACLLWEVEPRNSSLSPEKTREILYALSVLPNGCLKMEPFMPGIPRTSSNLGVLKLNEVDGAYSLTGLTLVRSSFEEDKQLVTEDIKTIFSSLGGKTEQPSGSPAWRPDPTTLILSLAVDEYRSTFGHPPKIMSTHAGLECGVFRSTYPDWDMISIGPTIKFPHSPDERVNIPSVAMFWRFLVALVARLR